MNTEITGIMLMFITAVLLALPLGRYMAKYMAVSSFSDPFFKPVERAIFKISGIDADQEQSWKQQMVAMLSINIIWFMLGIVLLMNQARLPLNPNQSAQLAFNTGISFLVN